MLPEAGRYVRTPHSGSYDGRERGPSPAGSQGAGAKGEITQTYL
jgi:hypothetical protein